MRRLLMLAVVPLLTSCGGAGHPGNGFGALEGTVFRAPATPTCVKGQSCSRRAPGVTLRFSRGDSVAATVTTRDDGSYKVAVPAGSYSVSAGQPVRPAHVDIPRNGVRRIDFTLETKIR